MEASISDSNDPPSCGDAYRAAVHGNLQILMKFNARELTSPINIWGGTIFHVLALNCHTKAVIELLNSLSSSSSSMSMINGLNTKNFNGNIPLHEGARVGALEIAKLMVRKEESLLHERNSMGETPLYWAAASGQKAMLRFLAMKNSSFNPPAGLRRNDGSSILHAAVMGEFYGLALEIMDRYPDLAIVGDKDGITVPHLLVRSPSSFKSGTFYSDINLLYSFFIPLALLELVIYFCMYEHL
ncbi:espin-like [Macadamia integrifolia]|uniref:espin-like n=1 Tax=Macadamia integrifolia TaxID=60698 RepID=UPI001C4E3B66|nr:espin-like [Macadamia integrifolia]